MSLVWTISTSKKQLKEHFTKCLEEEGLDPATETFEVEDAKSTSEILLQILEKLAAADKHFANLTAPANQQKEHLTAISVKADQQHTELSAKADQQSAKVAQQLNAISA